jgi:nitrogenase molybdenum-cofactor synthesis protein NifE
MSARLQATIAQVFDEPGCGINQGKGEQDRKKGCSKQLTRLRPLCFGPGTG